MYPNPQEALPLTSRPNLEQYRKLAKDLVKSCKSGDPAAIRAWAVRWLERLAALQKNPKSLRTATDISTHVDTVEQFARKTLSRDDAACCVLSNAQFVEIGRAHV